MDKNERNMKNENNTSICCKYILETKGCNRNEMPVRVMYDSGERISSVLHYIHIFMFHVNERLYKAVQGLFYAKEIYLPFSLYYRI